MTQIVVKWRLLRVISCCGVAAMLEEDLRSLAEENMKQYGQKETPPDDRQQNLDCHLTTAILDKSFEIHNSLFEHPNHRTFAFPKSLGVSMYACEIFNTHGLVTLTYILSCCSRIRK